MSEPIATNTAAQELPTAPHAGAGLDGGTVPSQPPTPGTTAQGQPTPAQPETPAGQTNEPYRAFASEAELNTFVQDRVKRAERSALKKLAKDLGFEDADELKDALEPIRARRAPGQGGGQGADNPAQPETPVQPSGPNDSERLNMALRVGARLNLPAALIPRLQGGTEAEMEADAALLVGLMGSNAQRGPGIPAVPQSGQPVTFTTEQLRDPKFVREHEQAIRQAYREGRIARS